MKTLVAKYAAGSTLLFLASCGFDQEPSNLKEAWNNANQPALISGADATYEFLELPLSGSTAQVGWSDDYWPTYKGGMSYRWISSEVSYKTLARSELTSLNISKLSPAEKYDVFMGDFNYGLVHMERLRTNVYKTLKDSELFDEDYKIPSWEGLCHGWAAAAVNFKEPKALTLVGPSGIEVAFGSSDIKALLTFYQQYQGNGSVKDYFMSERCNVSFKQLDEDLANEKITTEQYNQSRNEGACKGVNAGAFHVVLANEIGLKKESVIMDITRDAEVWNQPINSFNSLVVEETEGSSPGAAPGTVKEVQIRSMVTYSNETNPNWNRIVPAQVTASYEYVIELNEEGKIIGGRWISDLPRPDFLWRQTAPDFIGYFAPLEDIYEESTADLR